MEGIDQQIRFYQDIIRGCQHSIASLETYLDEISRERALLHARELRLKNDAAAAPAKIAEMERRIEELRRTRSQAAAFGGLTELERAINKRDRLAKKLKELEEEIEAHKD